MRSNYPFIVQLININIYRLYLLFQGVRLAKKFEQMLAQDTRFEVPAKRYLGMVVFRLKVLTLYILY